MTLPMPTLDHVVVNVRDRLDAAVETYRRLGFTMTPRGTHTLGSINHLAIFGTEYLELLGARAGDTGRPEILGSPIGLNGLVFGTEDSAAVYAALNGAGVPVEPPLEFSRPVELPEGARDATFRVVRLKPGRLVIAVQDDGAGFRWREVWGCTAAASAPRGRGIEIFRHYANGVRFSSRGNGVTLIRRFQGSE